MKVGTALSGGTGFLLGFVLSKVFGAKNGTALIVGGTVGFLTGGGFEYVVVPMILAKGQNELNEAAMKKAKNLNQAEADALAGQAKSSPFESDRQQIINVLAIGNYTYKDGKAIKNA